MTSSDVTSMAGRWVAVCGGSKGIGLEIAKELSARGAGTVLVARDAEALETAKDDVAAAAASGAEVVTMTADTSDSDDVARLENELRDRVGGLDGLVANAGTGSLRPFLELDVEEWDRITSVNLRGTFQVTQMAARLMIERQTDAHPEPSDFSILVVTSIRAWQYRLGTLPYATSKAGLQQFVRGAALELAPHRIRVNALAPGMTVTPLMLASSPDVEEQAAAKIPFGRAGQPIDMARAASFLLSPSAQFITGSTLTVDGGESLV